LQGVVYGFAVVTGIANTVFVGVCLVIVGNIFAIVAGFYDPVNFYVVAFSIFIGIGLELQRNRKCL
jgi:hypothetical protein